MIKKKLNEQEKFWKGSFGNTYISRNINNSIINSNKQLFLKINKYINGSKSLIEFGCNVGLNLIALKKINNKLKLTGVDINKSATKILMKNKNVEVINDSILNINLKTKYDITLIKGVLIHVNPKELNKVYEKLYTYSKKYIYLAEYYNPSPTKILYRGHKNKLFKRDFAGEMMDKYKDLKLIDYGFAYHRDKHPQDDLCWFLLKKNK